MSGFRTRWAAAGAAIAVTLGAGGLGLVSATTPSDAVAFVAITPCRVMDTRPSPDTVGPRSAPLGAADTHTVTVRGDNGNCVGIPDDAVAVSLNVTALDATLPTFLTIWATGQPLPTVSSLNPVPGSAPAPNAVVTELDGAGRFNVYNLQGTVNVIADVNGYYVGHHHDDRYYTKTESDTALAAKADGDDVFTKAEADERFERATPGIIRPNLFDLLPSSTTWSLSDSWNHDGTGAACLRAVLDVPAGSQISEIRVSHFGAANSSVTARVNSYRRGPGPVAGLIDFHFYDDRALPDSGGAVVQTSFTHSAADLAAAAPTAVYAATTAGPERDVYASICTDNPFTVISVTVFYE